MAEPGKYGIEEKASHFMPRIVRLVMYVISIGLAVAAPFVSVAYPEYGTAVVTAASVLSAAAGVTAIANLNG